MSLGRSRRNYQPGRCLTVCMHFHRCRGCLPAFGRPRMSPTMPQTATRQVFGGTGHSALVVQPTHLPAPSHCKAPFTPHDTPFAACFTATFIPSAQEFSLQPLPSTSMSLSSGTLSTPPSPSHCLLKQSPLICPVTHVVPGALGTAPQTCSSHVFSRHSPESSQSAGDAQAVPSLLEPPAPDSPAPGAPDSPVLALCPPLPATLSKPEIIDAERVRAPAQRDKDAPHAAPQNVSAQHLVPHFFKGSATAATMISKRRMHAQQIAENKHIKVLALLP